MFAPTLRLAALALIGAAMLTPTASSAQQSRPYDDGAGYARAGYDRDRDGYDRRNDRHAHDRRADRGRDARRCDRGDGGTIIGAIAGGLLGGTVTGRGNRGVGTVVGAGAGALAGRAIDRDC